MANPKGKGSREQVLSRMGERETLTRAGAASRANSWYGKKGSPHAIMDDFIAQQRALKDDGSTPIDSVSVPSVI